jgi:hypothetical protein
MREVVVDRMLYKKVLEPKIAKLYEMLNDQFGYWCNQVNGPEGLKFDYEDGMPSVFLEMHKLDKFFLRREKVLHAESVIESEDLQLFKDLSVFYSTFADNLLAADKLNASGELEVDLGEVRRGLAAIEDAGLGSMTQDSIGSLYRDFCESREKIETGLANLIYLRAAYWAETFLDMMIKRLSEAKTVDA